MLPIDPANKVLAENVNRLLAEMPERGPRPEVAARMDIGDKTLGFLKAGTGNPTLESIAKVARFFRKEPWQLLKPGGSPTADASTSLDASLLAKALEAALSTYQQAGRTPSNEQLAAAACFVYATALKGVRLEAAMEEVRALIGRAGSHQIELGEEFK